MDIATVGHVDPLKKQEIGRIDILLLVVQDQCDLIVEVYPYLLVLEWMLALYC